MNKIIISLTIILGAGLVIVQINSLPFSVISLAFGLLIVGLVSEPMVDSLKGFGVYMGLSDHVTGIISSLASNLPEGIMTLFMVVSPHLKEVAILTVMITAVFNGLLLSVLIIMLTYRGGYIELSKRVLEYDVEIMRVSISFCVIIFGTGILLHIFSEEAVFLPKEIAIFLLISYIGYIFFVSKGEEKRSETAPKRKSWMPHLALSLIGIFISAELISRSSEFFIHALDFHVVIAATLIGFAGSIPEHGIAIIGARKGHVELGVSNLLSGIIQSIMVIFPILAVFVPIPLDGFVLYQFLAVATTLWIVKKSIVDDGRLTLDEGLSILLIHILGILLFDELSLWM